MKRVTVTLSVAIMMALFVFPQSVFADAILYQGDGATDSGNNDPTLTFAFPKTAYAMCSTLPDWAINSVDINLRRAAGWQTNVTLEVHVANGGSTTIVTESNEVSVTSSTFATYNFEFNEPLFLKSVCEANFVAGDQLALIEFKWKASGGAGGYRSHIGGTTVLPGTKSIGNSGIYDSQFNMVFHGFDFGEGADTTTRITELISPENGEATPTNVVTFNYNYYFNSATHFGVLDEVCVAYTDVTISQESEAVCEDIVGSGDQMYLQYVQLTEGHTYTWKPYLTASTTSEGRIEGVGGYFSVVSAPVLQSIVPPSATSTTAMQQWFFAVQNAILSVPPWSYWVQLRSILTQAGGTLTATSTMPAFTFEIGASTTPITFNVNVFTEQSVTALIPPTFWDTAKVLMGAVMWVLFVLMLYHEVDRRFTKPH